MLWGLPWEIMSLGCGGQMSVGAAATVANVNGSFPLTVTFCLININYAILIVIVGWLPNVRMYVCLYINHVFSASHFSVEFLDFL